MSANPFWANRRKTGLNRTAQVPVLLPSAAVRGRRKTRRAPALLALTGLVLAVAVPGAGGAGAAPSGSSLHHRQALLGSRSHAALLSLYSLDSQLAAARARASSLEARLADVRAEQARAARDLRLARHAWRN